MRRPSTQWLITCSISLTVNGIMVLVAFVGTALFYAWSPDPLPQRTAEALPVALLNGAMMTVVGWLTFRSHKARQEAEWWAAHLPITPAERGQS